jgi:hypothetical protein
MRNMKCAPRDGTNILILVKGNSYANYWQNLHFHKHKNLSGEIKLNEYWTDARDGWTVGDEACLGWFPLPSIEQEVED